MNDVIRTNTMIILFYSNATAGSAEPAFGSHLAYHTDPQGNQNSTVTKNVYIFSEMKF